MERLRAFHRCGEWESRSCINAHWCRMPNSFRGLVPYGLNFFEQLAFLWWHGLRIMEFSPNLTTGPHFLRVLLGIAIIGHYLLFLGFIMDLWNYFLHFFLDVHGISPSLMQPDSCYGASCHLILTSPFCVAQASDGRTMRNAPVLLFRQACRTLLPSK